MIFSRCNRCNIGHFSKAAVRIFLSVAELAGNCKRFLHRNTYRLSLSVIHKAAIVCSVYFAYNIRRRNLALQNNIVLGKNIISVNIVFVFRHLCYNLVSSGIYRSVRRCVLPVRAVKFGIKRLNCSHRCVRRRNFYLVLRHCIERTVIFKRIIRRNCIIKVAVLRYLFIN